MAQKISQGSIAGRIGQNLGQSLAEMAPKESERYSLAQGLKRVGEEKGLTPFQQFAELSSIRGATPQMIHSGSELLRQQGISNELRKSAQEKEAVKPNPFPKNIEDKITGKSPSLTTSEGVNATLKNYIPKTFQQIQQRAGELLDQNPALYGNDPSKALAAAQAEQAQESAINQSYQARRKGEEDVQSKVENELKKQQQNLNAKVPGNVYSKVEDKAINSVKPIEEGGEGLTEQQAKKKYGNELDEISRNYQALESVGNYTLPARSPSENKRVLKDVREGFKKRNDLENLAQSYIGQNGLSPSKAYYLAYPSSEIKELNNQIFKLPKLENISFEKGFAESFNEKIPQKTLAIAPKLAKAMGKEGSPLSIAEELKAKNYDPDAWLDYVSKNRKELDLTERQARELEQPRNFFPNLNDNWLFLFSGLDQLVEQ